MCVGDVSCGLSAVADCLRVNWGLEEEDVWSTEVSQMSADAGAPRPGLVVAGPLRRAGREGARSILVAVFLSFCH